MTAVAVVGRSVAERVGGDGGDDTSSRIVSGSSAVDVFFLK